MTGPRPPPYIGKNIYKPGIGVHRLAVRAFSTVKAPKGLNPSHGYENATTHHGEIDLLRAHVRHSIELHPHGIIVMALCAICALAILPAIFLLTRKRHGWKNGPLTPTTAADFRTFFPTPDKGCTGRHSTAITINRTHQPGRERVLKETRLRLRRHRKNICQYASGSGAHRGHYPKHETAH